MIEYYILAICLLGALAVILYVYFAVRPVMPYLYLSSMLSARSSKLLNSRVMIRLSEATTLRDFVDLLSTTFFDVDAQSVVELERKFDEKYFTLIDEIREKSPAEFKRVLDLYLLFYEVQILKYLYSTKKQNLLLSVEQLSPTIHFDVHFYHACVRADFDEFIALFSQTPYYHLMRAQYNTSADFEDALDTFIFGRINREMQKSKVADKAQIAFIFSLLIDEYNFARCVRSQVRKHEVRYFDGGLVSSKEFASVSSIQSLIELYKRTPYYDNLKKALTTYESTSLPTVFSVAFSQYMKTYIENLLLKQPQGAMTVFSYVVRFGVDRQNIQLMLKILEGNLEKSQVEHLLI